MDRGDTVMEIVFFWLAFAIAVAVWAAKWDRNGFGWAVLAIAISPLLAGIFLAIAGRKGKICPECAHHVPRAARICSHCRHDFSGDLSPARF
jgi:hypothetical protein